MTYGIKDCANLTLRDKARKMPAIYSDYANVSTNEWSADRVFANAKGTNAIAWDSNKKSTLQVTMEVFDLKWLAILSGSEIEKKDTQLSKREVVYVDDTKVAHLANVPVDGSVAVIKLEADKKTHDGEPLADYDGEEVPATGQVKVVSKDITFAADAITGDAYAVYYLVPATGVRVMEIKASKFPKAYEVVGDVQIRNQQTGEDEFVQIEYPNARPQANFTITMSATDPTSLEGTFDLFPDEDDNMAVYKFINE
jgi:hypothetical protein